MKLVDIYYNSVGLNSSLLLNLPVDTRGLVHENEIENLNALAEYLRSTFSKDYSKGQEVTTSSNLNGYEAMALTDEDKNSYWVSEANDQNPTIELFLEHQVKVNTFMIQEYLPLGQRIKSFYFEVLTDGNWEQVYEGTTIGNKRLIRFDTQSIEGLRFTITDTKAQVAISNIGLYKAPE